MRTQVVQNMKAEALVADEVRLRNQSETSPVQGKEATINRPYVHPTVMFRSQVRVLFVRARVQFDVRFAVPGREGRPYNATSSRPTNHERANLRTLEVGPDLDVEDEADNWRRVASC
jgi:hypothetical protein